MHSDFAVDEPPLALTNDDLANLSFTLDEDHTRACVFFSKSSKAVTGISLVFFPSENQPGKLYQSALQAKSVRFNADRSYTVHFAPPMTDQQRD